MLWLWQVYKVYSLPQVLVLLPEVHALQATDTIKHQQIAYILKQYCKLHKPCQTVFTPPHLSCQVDSDVQGLIVLLREHVSTFVCVCGCSVALEEGFLQEAAAELEKKGHKVVANVSGHARGVFGRGQIIQRNPNTGVLWGGSDPRADGCVIGW